MNVSEIKKAIEALADLHKQGILSEEEFRQEKQAYLQQLRQVTASPQPSLSSAPHGGDLLRTSASVGYSALSNASLPNALPQNPDPPVPTPSSPKGDSDPRLGSLLLGRYELRQHLGQGGMGQVFLAYDRETEQSYALKLMHPDLAREEGFQAMFLRELRLTEGLNHPGIVRTHGFHRESATGVCFFLMEYLQGQTLAEKITQARTEKRKPLFPLSQILRYAEEITDALEYAHSKGVIHRDVKPSNLLVTPDDHIRLMDFSIAKVLSKTHATKHTQFKGTPFYMAPEQLRGEDAAPTTDVYSLGIVVYELLTGEIPQGHFVHPSRLLDGFSTDGDAVLLQALASSPSVRFQHPRSFLENFRRTTASYLALEKDLPLETKAARGDAEAQFNLGVCYENGEGVAKDPAQAVVWYQKAANQGNADAQFSLGVCYENGEGVAKDPAQAVAWYQKAENQGYAAAREAIRRLNSKNPKPKKTKQKKSERSSKNS